MFCIAKAYGGEPLKRLVVGGAHNLVYVLNPESKDAVENNPHAGVGFPSECVFEFDPGLFPRLQEAFAEDRTAELWALWQSAKPLTPELQGA
jgi:hypothetical protein